MPVWVDGITTAKRFLSTMTQVLVVSNQDEDGTPILEKNWKLIYPDPGPYEGNTHDVEGITLQPTDENYDEYGARWPFNNWDETGDFAAYVNGELIDETEYNVDYTTNLLSLTSPVDEEDVVTIDVKIIDEAGMYGVLDDVDRRIILQTTTTPKETDGIGNYSYEPDRTVSSLTMYLEMEQPERVINPELGVPYYLSPHGYYVGTSHNVFYAQARIFDELNAEKDGPAPRQVDEATGEVLDYGAHVSEWAKLSWVQDWIDIRLDAVDDTPGTGDLSKGIIFYPTDIATADDDLPIYFWCVPDNDGFTLVVRGDRSLTGERSITAFLYVGVIDPLEEANIADIGGNFAISSSSSTVPAWASTPPTDSLSIDSVDANIGEGTLSDGMVYAYRLAYTTTGGESPPSDPEYFLLEEGEAPGDDGAMTVTFTTLPEEARSWRLYRYDTAVSEEAIPPEVQENIDGFTGYKLLYESFDMTQLSFLDDGSLSLSDQEPLPVGRPIQPVVRDPETGTIVSIRWPRSWGPNTATGVADIAMYKSRSGAYFQRHVALFQAMEPFSSVPDIGRQPSVWTEKYHVSPVYVAHPVEGVRGRLRWLLAVFNHAVIDGDELVLNLGEEDEERYRYFHVDAPFSFFQSSPSERHAIALKKFEKI